MKTDLPWKIATRELFQHFIEFFLPQAAEQIDWSVPYEVLECELSPLSSDAEQGNRIADRVVKVQLKNQQKALVFVHIEVQGQRDPDLAKRMYIYQYRLYDRFISNSDRAQQIFSMALLCDPHADWEPDSFEHGLWGFTAKVDYPVIKLIKYRDQLDSLEHDPRLFALIVRTTLLTMAEGKNLSSIYSIRKKLVIEAMVRHHTKQECLTLLRVLEELMTLPPELSIQLNTQVKESLKEQHMERAMVSFERHAYQEGMQQGMQQGMQVGMQQGREEGLELGRKALTDIILLTLRQRIGLRDVIDYEDRLQAASIDELQTWAQRCITASGVHEIFEH